MQILIVILVAFGVWTYIINAIDSIQGKFEEHLSLTPPAPEPGSLSFVLETLAKAHPEQVPRLLTTLSNFLASPHASRLVYTEHKDVYERLLHILAAEDDPALVAAAMDVLVRLSLNPENLADMRKDAGLVSGLVRITELPKKLVLSSMYALTLNFVVSDTAIASQLAASAVPETLFGMLRNEHEQIEPVENHLLLCAAALYRLARAMSSEQRQSLAAAHGLFLEELERLADGEVRRVAVLLRNALEGGALPADMVRSLEARVDYHILKAHRRMMDRATFVERMLMIAAADEGQTAISSLAIFSTMWDARSFELAYPALDDAYTHASALDDPAVLMPMIGRFEAEGDIDKATDTKAELILANPKSAVPTTLVEFCSAYEQSGYKLPGFDEQKPLHGRAIIAVGSLCRDFNDRVQAYRYKPELVELSRELDEAANSRK